MDNLEDDGKETETDMTSARHVVPQPGERISTDCTDDISTQVRWRFMNVPLYLRRPGVSSPSLISFFSLSFL